MAFTNTNLPELKTLREECQQRSRVTKFIVKSSDGLSLVESNERAKKDGKIMAECHFFVDKNGGINRVRPEDYPTEYNSYIIDIRTILIEVEGEFTWENIEEAQYKAIVTLGIYLKNTYPTYNKLEPLNSVLNIDNPGPSLPLDEINTSIQNAERYGLLSVYDSAITKPIKCNIALTTPYTVSKEVLILKHKLIRMGIEGITLNNVYDEETATIINTICNMYGIGPSYTCTPEVVKILDALITKEVNKTKPVKVPKYTRLLYNSSPKYMEGDDVKFIQEKLAVLGYYTGDIDGKYGPETQSAVTKFQVIKNLLVTGNVDTITWKYIMAVNTYKYTRVLYLTEPRLEGSDVVAIQSKLDELGYTITITGIFDQKTEDAVKLYQTNNNLAATGAVNEILFNKLMSQ